MVSFRMGVVSGMEGGFRKMSLKQLNTTNFRLIKEMPMLNTLMALLFLPESAPQRMKRTRLDILNFRLMEETRIANINMGSVFSTELGFLQMQRKP
jgi:hypothetical protein